MRNLLLILLLVSFQTFGATLAFDAVTGATGYRALFSATAGGPTLAVITTTTTSLTYDASTFPSPYYVCVQSTDGTIWSNCSETLKISSSFQAVYPADGWSASDWTVFANTADPFRFTWNMNKQQWYVAPVTLVGGGTIGMVTGAPVRTIYLCQATGNASWGNAMVPCQHP